MMELIPTKYFSAYVPFVFGIIWSLRNDFLCQAMARDSRIVPGAAATEIELARRVKEFSFKETGYFFFIFFLNLILHK